MTTKRKKTHYAEQKTSGLYEGVVALGNTGTAKTVDVSTGTVFTATLTGNCTFTLSGAVSGQAVSVTLWITRDATTTRTIAFAGGTFVYPGAGGITQPDATASSLNSYVLTTLDGGTTWAVNVGGLGYA